MRKLNKNILWESSELDWIHSTGQNKILTINNEAIETNAINNAVAKTHLDQDTI